MGQRIRSFDWATSPLGPFESWQNSLKTTVRLMLNSRYPMFLWWGPEYINLYNDAYIPVLGARHPRALGVPAAETWREIWHEVGVQADAVYRQGASTWNDQILLVMERYGYPEETYFTFSYSPAPNDNGGIGGVFCACTEETERVLGERRLRALRQLATATSDARSAEDSCRIAAAALEEHPQDVAFALIYLIDPGSREARLVASTRISADSPYAPATEPAGTELNGSIWPLASAIPGHRAVIRDLQARGLPGGAWPEHCHTAAIVPLLEGGHAQPTGFLIAGASPRRPFDDSYHGFFDLVAGSIASAVANARAHEATRKRAEALAEIDRAKTIFFSNVSHELRTPLTLMLGPLQEAIRRDTEVSAELRGELEVAHRNGMRLLRLVNTILDFSRIEAGRMQALYEPVDLAQLTAEIAGVFRSAIERAGLQVFIDCEPIAEPVYIDRDMWEKIMLNLLSNALKFTFSGYIRVSLRKTDAGIELKVSDTGTGIPESEIPLIFQRFHRIAGARGRTHEGSGIGLALVYELAKMHGGSAQVESRIDQGSTFTVSIPAGYSHLPADRIAGLPTAQPFNPSGFYLDDAMPWLPTIETDSRLITAKGDGPRPRILVADDNADMRGYLRRVLQVEYEVETVADGRAALEAMGENPPDLILADLMMPQLDGIEMLRSIRKNPAVAPLPVILLTARADEQSMVEAMEARADDYLTKPFSAQELLARVGGHIAIAKLRRESSESLRASREELARQVSDFETLLREIPLGIAVASDVDCGTIRINPEFARILGVEATTNASKSGPESASLPYQMFSNGVELEPDELPMQIAAREAREVRNFEADIIRADGSVAHELGHAVPLFDDNGRVRGSLGVFVDITERRRIEEALRESEQRFRNMAENAPVMIWMTDADGRCTYVNRQWCEFTGSSLEDNLGLDWTHQTQPEDEKPAAGAFIGAHAARIPFRTEYRLRRRDAAWRWAVDSGTPRFADDGSFLGYIGSVIDITERKEMEHALRESEDQLARAQTAAGIGSWNWAPSSGTTSFSGEYFALYGLPRKHGPFTYRDWLACIHPEDRTRVDKEMQRSLQERRTLDIQFRVIWPDGSIHWLAGKGTVFCDDHGQPFRFTGVNFDITSRKEAEQELVRANDDLKQFAFAASHDLQEPLRIVINYTQLLERRYKAQLDERAAKIIETAVEAALRMERLLKGLRDYWQVSDRQAIRIATVDLNDVVATTVASLQTAITEADAVVTYGALPVVNAAEIPMTQVFQNLISNALKYRSLERRSTIHISSEQGATEYVITVSDNGIGIDSQYAGQVFGLFKRLHGQEYSGSGIGLSICQKIVERFGGRIWVESNEGSGAAFRFTLPVRSFA